jgi:CRP/FNR family transcriptional regulator, anaerobic regulatory protein
MYELFYKRLEGNSALTQEDKDIIETSFLPFECAKNAVLEEADKVPKHLYFINEGFARLMYFDDEALEVTSLIKGANSFITSFLNLIHQTKAKEQVVAITNCTGLKIERSVLVDLIEKNEPFKRFSILIFEDAMANAHTRANELATLSAELRYKNLVEQQPEIVQNVPIQFIASYLGIKPQSLSRIRKQIIK